VSRFSLRTFIFWLHLSSGVIAGFVVFSMSLTGVLLTYERQIVQWSARQHFATDAQLQQPRLSHQQLHERLQQQKPQWNPTSITVERNLGAPVIYREGRASTVRINPYSGEEVAGAAPSVENFFRSITGFHRWFNIEGESRESARWVTGISNLLFLFLVLSGMYLWLPKLWKWSQFKIRLWFLKKSPSGKARDFNWHHVFGMWSALPLIVIIYSGAVFFFQWPTQLINTVLGIETPAAGPGRGPGPGPGQGPGFANNNAGMTSSLFSYNLDLLFNSAAQATQENWQSITLSIPLNDTIEKVNTNTDRPEPIEGHATNPNVLRQAQDERCIQNVCPDSQSETKIISASVDWGNGAQAHKRRTLIVNAFSGEIVTTQEYSATPPAQKVRGALRFLHTGEYFGIIGQTIAGLVSLFALIMVWTGLALTYRRFFARKSQ
jgi:uncharacterized iron-regulated membrane protein